MVVNRWWELVDANAGIGVFTRHVKPELPAPPGQRAAPQPAPDGMAPRIANLPEWRAHLLDRLRRQAETAGDARLAELHDELAAYPGGRAQPPAATDVVVPLRYRDNGRDLNFLSITAVVGTPIEVTVSELAIEGFYPADAPTAAALGAGAVRVVARESDSAADVVPQSPDRQSFGAATPRAVPARHPDSAQDSPQFHAGRSAGCGGTVPRPCGARSARST